MQRSVAGNGARLDNPDQNWTGATIGTTAQAELRESSRGLGYRLLLPVFRYTLPGVRALNPCAQLASRLPVKGDAMRIWNQTPHA
jgi:hypothetical protein